MNHSTSLAVSPSSTTSVHTAHAVQLLGHFNAFLQHWRTHFCWQTQPQRQSQAQNVILHIQIDQFFQLHVDASQKPLIQLKCHYEQLSWLQQPDLKQLCYRLMHSTLQHHGLYHQLLVILYRHGIASARVARRDYFELIYQDLLLLQAQQNNAPLLQGQPAHGIEPALLNKMKYIDALTADLQQAWQQLQTQAYGFLAQLKTAVASLQSDLPVSWYYVRYASFDLKHYYQMSALWRPHLASLLAWCQESDNKLYWFLLSHDPEGVQNPNYFGYANLMQLQRGGVPLFEYKAQARRLFELPMHLFIYAMQLAFYQVNQLAWWPALLLRWILQPEVLRIMQNMSTTQFERMQRGLSMLWLVFERHNNDLQLQYLPNYCFALNALWQDYAFERAESTECLDFVFGRQIHNNLYSDALNIANIGQQTTSKSLQHHSAVWHRQSLRLNALQFPFDYAPFSINIGVAQFELIADSSQLQQTAKDLQNCLLSFAERIFKQTYFAFRVVGNVDGNFCADGDGDEAEQAALGVHYDAYYCVYAFDQCRGVRNQAVSADLKRSARRFVDYLNAYDIELWLPKSDSATELSTCETSAI